MRRLMASLFILLAGIACIGATSQPALDTPPSYECGRARAAIAIDGALDDAAWQDAPWTADFVDIVGTQDRPAPALRTRAKFLWDAEHLYVAGESADPRVTATIRQRDEQLYREQAFELFIDPGADGKDYLEVQINPLNTVCDLVMDKPYRDRGKANVAFDVAGMRTAVHVSGTLNDPSDVDKGWTIELAIPWAALKSLATDTVAPPRAGETWRMNLARVHPTDTNQGGQKKPHRDMWVWSAQGAINMHLPDRWGAVRFGLSSPAGKP